MSYDIACDVTPHVVLPGNEVLKREPCDRDAQEVHARAEKGKGEKRAVRASKVRGLGLATNAQPTHHELRVPYACLHTLIGGKLCAQRITKQSA